MVFYPGPWNWSAINNYGIREGANGDCLLLLNNDTEVLSPNWIEEMLMYAQRKDVGAVGALLYYPNGRIQHAGVIVSLGNAKDNPRPRMAWHAFHNELKGIPGYAGRLQFAQDMSAVTGACLMLRREVWEKVGGIDEVFAVGYNDIDLCLRIRKAGLLVVWTPHAELIHYESRSRGYDNTPKKMERSEREARLFRERWAADYADGDPYYNPNLSCDHSDFRIREASRS